VLQLALELLHAWDDTHMLSWTKTEWEEYTHALGWLLNLQGAQALSEQECNQLADVAIQKGRDM
jgi:hypothetical protein